MLATAAVLAGLAGGVSAPPPTTVLKVRPGRTIVMYDRARGRHLFRVEPRTVYGRRLILSVTRRRGAWAAVPTFLVRNGRRAWVRVTRRDFDVRRTRWRLRADLSRRRLIVLHGSRRVRTLRVAVGSRATPTPHGTFAITDKLPGARFGRAYGCCIVALSGHQPRLRTPVIDGRLAIHGTDRPGLVGRRVSEGCLRARDADVRWLMRTVPVGTQLRIVA
jgi:lipoprotein-anchoring transpeptidase ErfK/SrfK